MKIILSTEDKMVETLVGDALITMPTSNFRILDLGDLLVGDDSKYVDVEVYRGADDIMAEMKL